MTSTQFQYEVSGNWTDFEIGLEAGKLYSITAVGSYRVSDDAEETTAGGLAFKPFRFRMGWQGVSDSGYYRQGVSRDALIGRFAGQDWYFYIGKEHRFIAPMNAALELRINSEEDLPVPTNQFLEIAIEEIQPDVLLSTNGLIHISARLDTTDFLTISRDGIWWEHAEKGSVVGFHSGRHPTLLNGVAWWPSWPDFESSKRLRVPFVWNPSGTTPAVTVESGRGSAEVTSYDDDSITLKLKDGGASSGTMAIQVRH